MNENVFEVYKIDLKNKVQTTSGRSKGFELLHFQFVHHELRFFPSNMVQIYGLCL